MQRIIVITGPGEGKTHMAHVLEDSYRAQGIPCKVIYAGEVDLKRTLEDLRDFHGYIIVDNPGALGPWPKDLQPWQTIIVIGGHCAHPGDGLNPLPESQPAPSWSSSGDNNPFGEKGCQALCNALLCAISLLAQARCPRHADAR